MSSKDAEKSKLSLESFNNVPSLPWGCLQQLFQAQFPQKFEHFNMKPMQSSQAASPLAGGLPPKSPGGSETVRNLVGISKDKEAYEEWEAWEKYDARDGGGCAGTRAGRGVQMAEMDATQDSLRSGAGSEESGAAHIHAHAHCASTGV